MARLNPEGLTINHSLPCLEEALNHGSGVQKRGSYHSPGSDVQRPVHDQDELDVQFVALRVVPARFVPHKRWVLLCVCKTMTNKTIPMCVQLIQAMAALALKRIHGPQGLGLGFARVTRNCRWRKGPLQWH